MKYISKIKYKFVEFIPDVLEHGIIYLSTEFMTASHLCCCGCGNEVVTPISPTDWSVTFDGQSVSLMPSIGNWSFDCRSHYWITKSKIRAAAQWSNEQVEFGRTHDQYMKKVYYETCPADDLKDSDLETVSGESSKKTFWKKFLEWVAKFRPR